MQWLSRHFRESCIHLVSPNIQRPCMGLLLRALFRLSLTIKISRRFLRLRIPADILYGIALLMMSTEIALFWDLLIQHTLVM